MKSYYLILIMILVTTGIYAQNSRGYRKIVKRQNSVKLVLNKPSVYLQFERFGMGAPVEADEDQERIWLRLFNNTRWSITVGVFQIGDSTEEGLFYEVEKENDFVGKVPLGYRQGHGGSPDQQLKSGQSILFSVLKNHLAENLKICVYFGYIWERNKEMAYYKDSMPEYAISLFRSQIYPKFVFILDIFGNEIKKWHITKIQCRNIKFVFPIKI